jgi:hypothetical protein
MSAELLKFDGTFAQDQFLKDFRCPQCKQAISEQDLNEKNYQLWVSDYANEVEKSEFFSARLNRNLTCYNLTFWLKGVEHEICPDTEVCESCWERFLTANMKEFKGDYYCLPCQAASEEVKHE